jgi:hypothetical protein
MGNLYIGLLHFPMLNRRGAIVATALTSMDVHDIARTARTYGVARYFIITPLSTQQEIARRIRGVWTEGERAMERSYRGEAMELIHVAKDLEESIDWITEAESSPPLLVATSAQEHKLQKVTYEELNDRRQGARPVYIIFGTGWGMSKELIGTCDLILPPIMASNDFNHLSVRAAVAITLDRIMGSTDREG